jgi:hypothetical protein
LTQPGGAGHYRNTITTPHRSRRLLWLRMQDRFLGADLIRPPALPDAAKQPVRSGCKLSAGTPYAIGAVLKSAAKFKLRDLSGALFADKPRKDGDG